MACSVNLGGSCGRGELHPSPGTGKGAKKPPQCLRAAAFAVVAEAQVKSPGAAATAAMRAS